MADTDDAGCCSLDNLIIIWDPAKGHKVYTLEGHTSFVKGVAWDPIGKYLASQSDDKTVKVRVKTLATWIADSMKRYRQVSVLGCSNKWCHMINQPESGALGAPQFTCRDRWRP